MAFDSRSFDPTSVNPTLRSSLFFNDHYTFFMSLKFKYGINGYFCLIKLGLISFKGKKTVIGNPIEILFSFLVLLFYYNYN